MNAREDDNATRSFVRAYYESYVARTVAVTYRPRAELRPYVASYTLWRSQTATFPCDYVHIVPNGFLELFFFLGDGGVLLGDDPSRDRCLPCVVKRIGNIRATMDARLLHSIGNDRGLSIKLTPDGAAIFLGANPSSLKADIGDLEQLWGNRCRELLSRLHEAWSDERRVDICDGFFLDKLHHRRSSPQLSRLTDSLLLSRPCQSVEELADRMGLGYRSLLRFFEIDLGVGPKEYLRMLRFHRACSMLGSQAQGRWPEVILACGYYDQSHFIHEFKEITGFSPGTLMALSRGALMHESLYAAPLRGDSDGRPLRP